MNSFAFKRLTRRWSPRTAMVLGALGLLAVSCALALLLLPPDAWVALFAMAGLKLTSAGNFVIFAPVLEPSIPLSPWVLAALVITLDAAVVLMAAASLGFLRRAGGIGAWIRETERSQRALLERRPWIRRCAGIGLATLVILPGLGALTGTFFGRLLGLGFWQTFGWIMAGTAVVGSAFASGASALAPVLAPLQDELWFRAVGLGLLLVSIAAVAARIACQALGRKRACQES